MEAARIRIKAAIKCEDAECGHLERVVIEPVHRQVTHLVVHTPQGNYRVIPASLVSEAHYDWIHVRLTCEALEAAPPYSEVDFSLPSAEWSPPGDLQHADVLWPSDYAANVGATLSPFHTQAPLRIEHVNVPPNEAIVSEGDRVFCADRECGHVADVVMDPDSEKALGFVVRRGFLFKRDVEIPLGWIDHVEADGIHLKMTAEQVEELAENFPR
ncbi:MAG TPA: PRC-barrel domain-containing protein [Stenomitos sp.]